MIAANTQDRVVALAPQPLNVYAGDAGEEVTAKVGKEGARTIPVCIRMAAPGGTFLPSKKRADMKLS